MFAPPRDSTPGTAPGVLAALEGEAAAFVAHLATLEPAAWSRTQLRDALATLARVESAVAAAQARLTVAVDERGDDGAALEQTASGRSSRDSTRRTRRARALTELPPVADALARGAITPEHADLLVGAADRTSAAAVAADSDLLDLMATEPVDIARRRVQAWVARHESTSRAETRLQRLRERRRAGWWVDHGDGLTHVHVRLDPVAGAAVTRALEAETDRLWRHDGGRDGSPDEARTPQQRRADAVVALLTGSPARTGDPAPRSGGGIAVELVVSVDLADLLDRSGAGSIRVLDTGPLPRPVLDEILRCHPGSVHVRGLVFDGAGRPLWLGRRRRLASDDLRLVLALRDQGCVSCGAPTTRCDAHHVVTWARQGTTDPDNLVLLCSRCHARTHRLHGSAPARGPDGRPP